MDEPMQADELAEAAKSLQASKERWEGAASPAAATESEEVAALHASKEKWQGADQTSPKSTTAASLDAREEALKALQSLEPPGPADEQQQQQQPPSAEDDPMASIQDSMNLIVAEVAAAVD